MKKLVSMTLMVLAVCALVSCGKKISYEGTPVEKAKFSFLKPNTWNQTSDSDTRIFMKDEDSTNVNVEIEADEALNLEKSLEYYNDPEGIWEVSEAVQGDGFELKGFKKKKNDYYIFVAPLADGKGGIKVSVGTALVDDNPMSHEIVKEIISTIKLK